MAGARDARLLRPQCRSVALDAATRGGDSEERGSAASPLGALSMEPPSCSEYWGGLLGPPSCGHRSIRCSGG
eukprot:2140657-Pyramimonas_sp.AAC.1